MNWTGHTLITRRLHPAFAAPIVGSVEVCVFGPIEVGGPSGPIELTRAKERAVLAALALFHGRVVSTDRLVEALWGDRPPRAPEKALHTHIQRVRATLGAEVVETHADGYALTSGVVVDAALFETEAKAGDSARDLRTALARWKGDPYADLGEWVPAELERTRLSELRDHALETCLALEIEAGPAADNVAELETMVADKPLSERRWFLLMTALSRAGRVADALRTYQRARRVFAEELGIDPGPVLRNLEEQILLADVQDASPGNLPRQLTSFVGREREVKQLADLVRERSLVTLTGVGGVGKTRLVLATAAEVSTDFRHGAWFCDLAPLADPEALWQSLVVSLGVPLLPGRNRDEVVLEYLAAKRLLLVLDNCEHLLAAASRAAAAIVQSCPGVTVLATSRERLAVPGEQVIAVSPLPVPPADASIDALIHNDAVHLFCERALDADHAFTLSDRNASAVAQLCRHLDGLPLAIELAAAGVRSLSPGDLLARIDDRFRILTKGSRSAPERHQTLRYTIEWSYNLLSDAAQQALKAMSVFAGGCDLASAEAVLGGDGVGHPDVADLLGDLVDKSLVEVDTTDACGRYRLLETIRQYASERLEADGEAEELRRRHTEHFVAFAAEAGAGLRGAEEVTWTARVETELDNLRGALAWSVAADDADLAVRLVAPLAGLVGTQVGYATSPWAGLVLALSAAPEHRLYPEIMAHAGWAAVVSGDIERGVELTHGALELASAGSLEAPSMCHVLSSAAGVAAYAGDGEEAGRLAEDWLILARSLDDDHEVAGALIGSAVPFLYTGDQEGALVRWDEATAAARRLGSPTLLSYATAFSARIRVDTDPVRAQDLFDEALRAAESVGNQLATNVILVNSADIPIARGDWKEAARRFRRASEEYYRLGDSNGFRTVLVGMVWVLASGGVEETAIKISGAARVESANGSPLSRFVETVASLRRRVGDDEFDTLASEGWALDDDEIMVLIRRALEPLLTESDEGYTDDAPGSLTTSIARDRLTAPARVSPPAVQLPVNPGAPG